MQENCWPHLTATQLFPFMLMSPEFRPICDRFHKLHRFSTSSHAVSYLRSAEFLLCLCSAKARPVGEDKMPVTAALSSTYVEPDVKIQTTADTDSDDADSDTSSLQLTLTMLPVTPAHFSRRPCLFLLTVQQL